MRSIFKKVFSTTKPILFVLSAFVLLAIVSYATITQAENLYTTGWSWSGNVGWIKGNTCADTGNLECLQSQGLTVDSTTGAISGYVWSSNIGWISFNTDSLSNCTTTPCTATVDWTGSGPYKVKGWARACSVFDSGCSGTLKGNEYRGKDPANPSSQTPAWDGFISLNGTKSTGSAWVNPVVISSDKKNMTGYAWGGDVVGWIQMNFAVAQKIVPECSDGKDNADPEDTIADYPKDPGCYGPTDPDETDGGTAPQISYLLSQCISTTTEKPKLAWDTVNANQCRILFNGGTDTINSDYTKTISSQIAGGTLDSDGHYYRQTTLAANGYNSVFTLDCIGNWGTKQATVSVPQCNNNGTTYQCNDGVDNSDPEDTLIDQNDPGCHSDGNANNAASYVATDNDETNSVGNGNPECSDGVDNSDPEDTFIDKADPGCHADGNVNNNASYEPNDNDERDNGANLPACSDNFDNDRDGKIDYKADGSGDPGCTDANDNNEQNVIFIER